LRSSGLSCAGSRSGAIPPTLRRADPASSPAPLRPPGCSARENMTSLEVIALEGLPLVRPEDHLIELIGLALTRNSVAPRAGDVLVVAQKIASKAEGRIVDVATIEPSAKALALAAEVDKDARLVEVILSESVRVVRARRGVLIVEHRLGFIMANAGVDQSNVG